MKGSRTAALLSGLTAAAAVALTACGVPPSGVIEAGAPASGMFSPSAAPPSPPATVSLFFLRDGDLTPYPRRIDDVGNLEAVIHLLFEGPAANETATATTELPRLTDAPRVVVADGILFVQLPGKTVPLSRRAMLQLTCTVNHAEADGGTAPRSALSDSLHVLGDGWTMTQSDHACPVMSPAQQQSEAPTPWEPSR
ncbi:MULTISPECIES: hypothetical protein [Streptomyces]|uniref:Lipoprotein n=1 Tax=Streptomyces edwardsiae TaxID=3075527 RepID=A0ABU2QMU9_9ACTN|nr:MULTISPECIES: hypothetical protein [unclassified Streptomyces]MDT0405791.1 hypothetical protein [Streptomyces sp. DSM 41635]